MLQEIDDISSSIRISNPQGFTLPYVVNSLFRDGQITESEGVRQLQEFYEGLRVVYTRKIEEMAEKSSLLQQVLDQHTTYEMQAQTFQPVLQLSLTQKLKQVVHKPDYDRELFQQLKRDLSSLSDLFDLKGYTEGENLSMRYRSPDSRVNTIRTSAGVGVVAALLTYALFTSNRILLTCLSGFCTVGSVEAAIFSMFSGYDDYKLVGRAKNIDDHLDKIYFGNA